VGSLASAVQASSVDRAATMKRDAAYVLKNARTLRRLCLLACEADTGKVARIGGAVQVRDLGEFTLVKIAASVEAEWLCRYLREWIECRKPPVLATIHYITIRRDDPPPRYDAWL
jgi:hypothetical protein